MKRHFFKKSASGFTLIELLTVVAIISVLASVALPNLIKFQSKARQSEARINLKAAYTASKSRYAENGDYSKIFLFSKPAGAGNVVAPLDFEKYTIYRYRGNRATFGNDNDQYICTKTNCWPGSPNTPVLISGCSWSSVTASKTTFVYTAFGQIDYDLNADIWSIDSNNRLVNTSMTSPGTFAGSSEEYCNDVVK